MRGEVRAIALLSERGGLADPLLRASTEHSIRLGPELINPECAVREQGGLAWPPRSFRPASAQPVPSVRQPRLPPPLID
jgi:hypothetical protein